jgi:internalin A
VRWLVLIVIASCAHPKPPVQAVLAAQPGSIWPVPMRVMTWTSDGIVQVGELPDHPPTSTIATPWFVEPERVLGPEEFSKLVAALRSEHIHGLSLRGQAEVRLDKLESLPDLTALVLDDTPTTDDDLAELRLVLERLYLQRTDVDDAGIAHLVTRQPQLQVLDVEGCAIGNPAAIAISRLAELHALDLASTLVDDTGGAELGTLAKLEILDLGNTKIGERTIAAIRPLALRELFIGYTLVGKEIATLGGYAPGLVRFDAGSLASEYKPTDADVAWLANAPNLVEVGLSGANIHDKLALMIFALPGLRVVRFAATKITNAPIVKLVAHTELRELDLGDTPVDDASAAAFLALPELHMLRLDGTPIGDAGLAAVPGPKLEELYVSHTKVTDIGLAVLDRLPHLIGLGLGETAITEATIARVAKLVELRTLVLSKTRTEQLGSLGALHRLERLYLNDTHLGDTDFANYGKLTRLRVLHVDTTDISNDSLDVLRGFKRLEELTIGDTRVEPDVTRLELPHVHTLSLVGLELHDTDLAGLAHLTALTGLDLSATEVTDPSPLAMLPNLRVLGLAETKLSKTGIEWVKTLAARGIDIRR